MLLSQDRKLAAEDYFTLLLDGAHAAHEQGNYAISAALVIRDRGIEVVSVGTNTVFGSRDPSGHAEMNAIRFACALGAHGAPDGGATATLDRGGSLIVRRTPGLERESILYTTLEPCPMCTACIITAGIGRVVIAAEDPLAGALSSPRLQALAPLWPELAQSIGLEVAFCQSVDPESTDTYLPPALHEQLIEIFLASREPLDRALGSEGVLDVDSIHAHAVARLES